MEIEIDKNNPSSQWLDDIKRRYPCENEVDRVLTRKMLSRSGPAFVPQTIEDLTQCLEGLVRENVSGNFEIKEAKWLSGGASKIQMYFLLEWEEPESGRKTTPMVLRMEPAESLVETSRVREYEVIKAFEGVVPVPRCYWIDAEGKHFPYPAAVMAFVDGVTKPENSRSNTTGMGTYMPPEVRQKLGLNFVNTLADIHSFNFKRAHLPSFSLPETGKQSLDWAINLWARVWQEDSQEQVPLLAYAQSWLRKNMPLSDDLSLIHCDYRVGNFLFDEKTKNITAVLDWEMARIGDIHQDLAWASSPSYGHYDEDGKTFLVGGLLSEPEFYDRYQERAKKSLDTKRLHYYRVFITYIQCVISASTAYRIALNGKTHQDVLQCWLLGVAPSYFESLRNLLEKGE